MFHRNKKIAVFVYAGLWMSLAWPLRGQFGHWEGAAICGVFGAAAIVSALPSVSWRRCFTLAAMAGAFGFALADQFLPGYGRLIESVLAAPNLQTAGYDLIQLFFIGSIWGGLGAGMLGMAFSENAWTRRDTLFVILLPLCGYYLSRGPLAPVLLLFSPGLCLLALLHGYNLFFKRSGTAHLFSLYGFFGFGLSLAAAVILLYEGVQGRLPGSFDWWTLRDQIWGLGGGVTLAAAAFRAQSKGFIPHPVSSVRIHRAGFLTVLVLVPAVNTWDVWQKWFSGPPPVAGLFLPGIFLGLCFVLLGILALVCLRMPAEVFFADPLPGILKPSLLFTPPYLVMIAILKSLIYAGPGVWETGFTLMLIQTVLLGAWGIFGKTQQEQKKSLAP